MQTQTPDRANSILRRVSKLPDESGR